ncbi:hypothetical protein TWF506_000927 [Arthrobotrys conoides]|uniref:Uncharacterized protein n=1 Tax=Arthrobotrys conoides TaxID=74498 RepID=A0AAN8NLW0_9PEZI
MHRIFHVIELVENILLQHASTDEASRRHIVTNCRLVHSSWNDLISQSPGIRSLTWQYTLYTPGAKITVHTPFMSLERYFQDKWQLLQCNISYIKRNGSGDEPYEDAAKRIVGMYFRPPTAATPKNDPLIFEEDSKIQFLKITIYGYNNNNTILLKKGKLRGRHNLTISRLDGMLHDALLVDGYDLGSSSPKICIQLFWRPPIPGIPNQKEPDVRPTPYSVRVLMVQVVNTRVYYF